MPDVVSFREGALIDTAGVALHGLLLIGVTPGGSVAVIGPGPIGLLTMRLAKILGASRVIAVGRGSRLDAAKKTADILVDFEKDNPVKTVREITGGLGVDECAECSGAEGTFRQAVEMVRRGGRVALLGVPPASVIEPVPFKHIVHEEIMITGVRANPNVSNKLLQMIQSGQLVMKDLITHTFPLEEFGTALDTFVARREGAVKVVIEPNGKEIP
jgi:L-iditol 2-dehydrogenase